MGLDWVILLVNNVINVNQDWPMNREDLFKYVEDKYGSVEGVRHYETLEYLHTDGSVLLKSGYQVPEDFQYTKPDGSIVPSSSSRIPVSYYAYENEINETKRNIYLLRPQYLTDFVAEFKKLAMYLPNAEVDENGYKKTQGSLAEEFIGLPKYNKPSQSTASTGSASGSGSSTSLVSKGST